MGNIEKFDEMSCRYDTEERAAVAKIIAAAIERRINDAGVADDACAVDYGCGTGLVGIELVHLFKTLIFIDAVANMTEQVKKKIANAGVTNAEAVVGDLMSDRPPRVRADYLILSQVLLHIREAEEILRRAFDILNPNGRLYIIDFEKNEQISSPDVHNGFVVTEICESLKGIGFKEVWAEVFYRAENLFMNKEASMFIVEAVR